MAHQLERKPRQSLVFLKNFFLSPRELGSCAPSSRFLVERLLRYVDWDKANVFVEYGPGVGTFTFELLDRMGPDSHVVVLETNEKFVRVLEEVEDPRLHVAHRSAADVAQVLGELGLGRPDYILSGIPLSLLSRMDRLHVLNETREILKGGDGEEDGVFLVYQFRRAIIRYLREVFPRIASEWEPLNIPPATVVRAWPTEAP